MAMEDHTDEIAALEAILNSGTSRVSVDGMAAEYDMAEVRKRLAELKSQDLTAVVRGRVRPSAATIKLNYN